ncbi:hypothetical protein [Paraglaciecola sp. L3A3]|uniref:hypothetical protein n=1 Tax=Paraglaciecola sp. L3A3 TaxID=2686358 RepID=UPI00131BDA59|nr:hypothetical protein [Paraglaciecola sp. L3A3]
MQENNYKLNEKKPQKLCLVIGNGPSAKLVNYDYLKQHNIDFIGMNTAFRYWDVTGIYPTYYISVDTVVTKSNAKDIIRLINESKIKKFFLSKTFSEIHPEYEFHEKVVIVEKIIGDKSYKFLSDDGARTTGAWGLRVAAEMGYGKVSLIGFDGVREELLKEAERVDAENSLELRLKSSPKFNPNYFFSGYQQKGDSYQVPNVAGYTKQNGIKLHTDAVRKAIYDLVHLNNIEVYSHSHDDYSGLFTKCSTLGLINQENSPSKIDGENLTGFQLEAVISEIKNQYGYILATDIDVTSVDSFYIGKPINSSADCIIDPELDLNATLNGRQPTYFVKNSFFESDTKDWIEFNLSNVIRWGGVIEWEIECENGIVDYIDKIDIESSLKTKILNYDKNVFINLDGNNVNFWHTFKMCLKDFFFERNVCHQISSSLPRETNQSININSAGESNLSDNLLFNDGAKINQKFLLLYHGLIDVRRIRLALTIVSETDEEVEFSIAPNRTSPSTREKSLKPQRYKLKKNERTVIEFSNIYKHRHNVTRVILSNRSNSNFQVNVESAVLTIIDKSGIVHLKTWLSKPQSINNSREVRPQESGVFVFIESDMVDMQGHYYRYVCNLLGHKSIDNWRKVLVARENMNVGLEQITNTEIKKVYNRNTWTIQTNEDNFYERTVQSLESLHNLERPYIYIYTGSIFHAIQLGKILSETRFRNAYVTCNLFWEMIKDTGTDKYINGFKQLSGVLNANATRLKLTAPTNYVQELVYQHTGMTLEIAPHPATGFDDELFSKRVKSYSSDESKSRKNRNLILFPGVNTQDKGYQYGIEIAEELSKQGYRCLVRPSEGIERKSNLDYLELGVSENEFDQVLKQADLIVLPYMPSGFKSRTSGLVVDALYNGANCCVIENTWLEEFVKTTGCGISICENNYVNAVDKIISYIESNTDRTVNITGMTEYFNKNSWEKLIKQVTWK